MNKLFWENYQKWLDSALVEYNEKYADNRRFHQDSGDLPEDYNPGELVEFTEDGNAYPHSNSGTNYIPNAVTPWKESPFYIR